MLSKDHEIQYVALRNIRLLLQKEPRILDGELKIFFVQYNDPVYVQVEKVELMIMLATDDNIDTVLEELMETTEKVDVQLVRMAIRAVARCAIKLDSSADKCVKILVEIISNNQDLAVSQEGIAVMKVVAMKNLIDLKNIYRRYPGRFEPKSMAAVTAHIRNIDEMEPGPKSSLVWILGEYANSIDEAPKTLDLLMTTFKDEAVIVQLNLLTSMVKLFLKKPSPETRKMVEASLDIATKETDHPDVRDRGYVYWRLLAQFPDKARSVVLVSKPEISAENQQVDPAILPELLGHLGSLASVIHELPETFIKTKFVPMEDDSLAASMLMTTSRPSPSSQPSPSESKTKHSSKSRDKGKEPVQPHRERQDRHDRQDRQERQERERQEQHQQQSSPALSTSNPFRTTDHANPMSPPPQQEAATVLQASVPPTDLQPSITDADVALPEMVLLLHPAAEGANGLQVDGNFFLYKVENAYSLYLELFFTNHSQQNADDFHIKFNKNTYQISPGPIDPSLVIPPGRSVRVPLPCSVGSIPVGDFPSPVIQIALKSSLGVVIFTAALPVSILLVPEGRIERDDYLQMWRMIEAETNDDLGVITGAIDVPAITGLLHQYLIFLIAERVVDSQVGTDNTFILMELALSPGECKLCTKTSVEDYIPLIRETIVVLLSPLLNLRAP